MEILEGGNITLENSDLGRIVDKAAADWHSTYPLYPQAGFVVILTAIALVYCLVGACAERNRARRIGTEGRQETSEEAYRGRPG